MIQTSEPLSKEEVQTIMYSYKEGQLTDDQATDLLKDTNAARKWLATAPDL